MDKREVILSRKEMVSSQNVQLIVEAEHIRLDQSVLSFQVALLMFAVGRSRPLTSIFIMTKGHCL